MGASVQIGCGSKNTTPLEGEHQFKTQHGEIADPTGTAVMAWFRFAPNTI
jgi:hypothetical protein